MPALHFHDPGHTGNTLASKTGTSLRDRMARMGPTTRGAALIYQHRTSEADQTIARAVSERVEAEQHSAKAMRSGPAGRGRPVA
jgi:hypothetical protein